MRRTYRRTVIVFIFVVSLLTCVSNVAQTTSATEAKPVSLPAAKYIPSRDFDTRNIVLNLRFDWKLEQAVGNATITFSPLVENLKTVHLDAADMTVTAVRLVAGKSLKFLQEPGKQQLTIDLDTSYRLADSVGISIDYHTNGTAETRSINGGGGLSFIQPSKDDPKRPRQIWSQGESIYSHYWFPCFDNPNDFFTSEVIATVEKPLMVISNGKLVKTIENADGTRTFDWLMDQPHASYLTSIAVGEYVPVGGVYNGIPVNTYVYPSEVSEGKLTTARLVDMVRFFSERTGVQYPYAKYAQTVARDFSGGMENISATTQTDQLIHDARAELDQTSDSLQSHELAHQWFGDFLTCRSWADLWLNESFATYFQALWDEHSLGTDDFLYLDVRNNQEEYLNNWEKGLRRPIVTENYANPDAVFDVYDYQRGGAVLHMLRKSLGDDNWWRAINHYLTKYAHQPVQTEQFRIAIEEATGQSMDQFFDEWLYRMGHPVFDVTQKYDQAGRTLKLTVRQTQKVDATSMYPQVAYFKTPVDVEIVTASGQKVERVTIAPVAEQTISIDVDSEPLIVNFDYQSTVIKELHFEKPTTALIFQMQHDPDVTGRLWALDRLKDKLDDRNIAQSEHDGIAIAVAGALGSDRFWGARVNFARALAHVPGTDVRKALVTATKDSNARVREAAVSSLATESDAQLTEMYIRLLADPSYAVDRVSAQALGQTKDPRAYENLVKLSNEPSWHQTNTTSALMGLEALGDKRGLEVALKNANSEYKPVRAQALLAMGTLGKGESHAFQIISEALRNAFETQDTMMGSAAADALADLGDPRGLELLTKAQSAFSSPDTVQMMGLQLERLKKEIQDSASATGGKQPK